MNLGSPLGSSKHLPALPRMNTRSIQFQKRTGGYREIHHPSRRLKALQRWLLSNIIEALPVHPAAAAYRRNRSIFENARAHAASRYLLRMDLENFFPSITSVDVRQYIKGHSAFFLEWTEPDINVFCGIVCRNSRLTIGAPTSPALSNSICYDLDVNLHALCENSGVAYTRYADDLFFSTVQREVLFQTEKDVIEIVDKLKIPANLKVNGHKTRHSSKRGSRRVTGIVLGSDGAPHVGRGLKRKIRALIHRFDSLDEPNKASLAGLIAYAIGFEPAFLNRLIDKYGLPMVNKAMTAAVRRT